MTTTTNCTKTFVLTGIFSPELLASLYDDLDNKVDSFISQEQIKVTNGRVNQDVSVMLISASDNIFFFKEGICNCNSSHPCNFGVSRVITYSIKTESKSPK
ncbi:MAG: hypothetical protein ACOYL8_04295 [Patescibacteria group bacterium]